MLSTPDVLREILRLEEQGDWGSVEVKSVELIEALANGGAIEVPDEVYHFIDDFDIRQRDHEYAERQRSSVRAFLDTN